MSISDSVEDKGIGKQHVRPYVSPSSSGRFWSTDNECCDDQGSSHFMVRKHRGNSLGSWLTLLIPCRGHELMGLFSGLARDTALKVAWAGVTGFTVNVLVDTCLVSGFGDTDFLVGWNVGFLIVTSSFFVGLDKLRSWKQELTWFEVVLGWKMKNISLQFEFLVWVLRLFSCKGTVSTTELTSYWWTFRPLCWPDSGLSLNLKWRGMGVLKGVEEAEVKRLLRLLNKYSGSI